MPPVDPSTCATELNKFILPLEGLSEPVSMDYSFDMFAWTVPAADPSTNNFNFNLPSISSLLGSYEGQSVAGPSQFLDQCLPDPFRPISEAELSANNFFDFSLPFTSSLLGSYGDQPLDGPSQLLDYSLSQFLPLPEVNTSSTGDLRPNSESLLDLLFEGEPTLLPWTALPSEKQCFWTTSLLT